MVLNITDKQKAYANEINSKLLDMDIRSESDLSNEKISYKIRNHALLGYHTWLLLVIKRWIIS